MFGRKLVFAPTCPGFSTMIRSHIYIRLEALKEHGVVGVMIYTYVTGVSTVNYSV